MNDPTKDIAVVYNPKLLPYPSNNPFSFRYPDPDAVKANDKNAKSRPIGMLAMKGGLLSVGVNWVDTEILEQGILKSPKGQEWKELGVIQIIPKRQLKSPEDKYTGTIADYKGQPGATEFTNIQSIIRHTWDRNYLQSAINQAPALFEGEGVRIVQKACEEQIKRIDTQIGATVDAGQFYKNLQTA